MMRGLRKTVKLRLASSEVYTLLVLVGILLIGVFVLWQYVSRLSSPHSEAQTFVPVTSVATQYGNRSVEVKLVVVAQPGRINITGINATVVSSSGSQSCNVTSVNRNTVPPRTPVEIVVAVTCPADIPPGATITLSISWSGGGRSGVDRVSVRVS